MHLATLRHGLPGVAHLVNLGERMALKPLGHRILIQPDTPPEQTDSGLVLPADRDHVPVSGTVVAVGSGPERDANIRSAVILRCIGIAEEIAEYMESQGIRDTIEELRRYKNQMEQFESPLKVGDRVVYPVESGLQITEDGRQYIILNEDDVVVIATEESEAA